MPAISAIEWDIIEAKVATVEAQCRLPNSSAAFLYLILSQFFPDRVTDYPEMIVDGSNDLGVDAIEIIEREDQAEIFIFQSKHRSSLKSTDRTINDPEVLRVASFLHALFDKDDNLIDGSNLQLFESVNRIWALHKRGIICRYRVIYCSNGRGFSPTAQQLAVSAIGALHGVEYEFYGPEDLIRDIGAAGREHESGVLQVVGREAFERSDGDIRGVIASVDARSFVEMIQTEDRRSIKRNLFDENLRIFLGANGGYNSDIIETAISDDSHLFWYLNNGITITCRNYAYNKGHSNPIIRIDDFQIVNGAQTSHSLLEAFKRSPEAFDNVVLLVRVYATNRSDIAERVAVATNSQARIQARDLRANHPVLKKLEIAFQAEGYFFERKRNMHADKDSKKRIDALKLGQILLSFKLREPDRAKADSDKIFGDLFQSVFHEHYEIAELCRLVELYRIIEEFREAHASAQRSVITATGEHQYLVYGHWFVLYAAKLIITRKNAAIPTGKAAQELVLESLALVAKACSSAKSTAQYQMFRSSKTKDRILTELEGGQMSLFPADS